jgi:hypothetical protein
MSRTVSIAFAAVGCIIASSSFFVPMKLHSIPDEYINPLCTKTAHWLTAKDAYTALEECEKWALHLFRRASAYTNPAQHREERYSLKYNTQY